MIPTLLLAITLGACADSTAEETSPELTTLQAPPEGKAYAVFAGGCFWCMEGPFDKLDGVTDTVSGYTSGKVASPTYAQVSSGATGHTEGLRVTYDPAKVTYEELLEVFWHNHDPLDAGGQFCDRGTQYRAGIYPRTPEEREAAEASKKAVQKELGKKIETEIVDATRFWDAEDYHQNYYETHPYRYTYYRGACGRDRRLTEVWGDKAGH